MRQSQQNRRGRGRNNNNRKGQNPLTRSYESNGPDVKIRGTPSHIAEKYVTMARDALSAGDPVLAENYLQHAEHYNRIIMTHREQQVSHSNDHAGSSQGRGRSHSSEANEDDAAAGDDQNFRSDTPPPGSEPQPNVQANDSQAEERPRRRSSPSRDRNPPSASAAEGERGQERPANGRSRSRRSRYSQTDDQPEFLKRPVRRPRSTEPVEEAPEESTKSDEAAE